MTREDTAGAVLSIDAGAIVTNWRALRDRAAPAECAAVVKADAYGLGVEQVAPALWAAGCRVFFVATLDEAITLRWCLQRAAAESEAEETSPPAIFVLNGAPPTGQMEFVQYGLIPVLNTLDEIGAWASLSEALDCRLPAAIHVDTGMARLGLPPDEFARLCAEPDRLSGIALGLVLSHLACADAPGHPLNHKQRAAFATARSRLPAAPASLAASSGVFLGDGFLFDLVRPGYALYGGSSVAGETSPMQGVVRLEAPVLQVRQIDTGESVGYGASYAASGPRRIATVGVGYADGILRSLGNCGAGYIGGWRVPIVGRISMDLTTFDVTGVDDQAVQPGTLIELIGPHHPIDEVAREAGTIGYEILTSLGNRYARRWLSAAT
ncbi:MAG: alanine racemase [Rhodospirillales bacterium]|nr:alanine racemase [Rhodospirillales bacterium]